MDEQYGTRAAMSPPPARTCRFDGCGRNALYKGLCNSHYAQTQRGQPLTPIKPYPRTLMTCRFTLCNRDARHLGLCGGHYSQQRSGKELSALVYRNPLPPVCVVPGCDREDVVGYGLCRGHYSQQHRGLSLSPIGASGKRTRRLVANPAIPGTLLVPLTRGLFAIVDEVDGEAVGKKNWHAEKERDCGTYAAATFKNDGGESRQVMLHRFIGERMGLELTALVDHENRNGLDCRRGNLRDATPANNMHNRVGNRSSALRIKGVYRVRNKYQAQIMANGKKYFLGTFEKLADAVEARRAAGERLHGAFARVAA